MNDERDDHDHHHGHDHPGHVHPPLQRDDSSPPNNYEETILAIRDLLLDKGILSAEQVRRGLATLDSWEPSRGAEIVPRAWVAPEFTNLPLAAGHAAEADFGLDVGRPTLT